jgi:hypothetical protein
MGINTASQQAERFHPIAGVLAIILPGAGHIVIGEVKRGSSSASACSVCSLVGC